ncbi:hypothetical protein GCM10011323_23880 [Pontibacter amylolyticus]|uniref:XRE family transcriptional regulator n=2 Tax=Pontibacter amylolyticus TaxID=1424080 RepID=A0ABQ1W8B6_9BACT|nr:hypothetical protein GCM10011323_23880 [Pontibacter amylolyticus]
MPVSSIEFDKTYRVRQKRLAMGYTARELSFLLGYHPLYVRNLEDPTSTKKYNATETNYLRLIFDCPLSDLMPGKIEEPFYQIQVDHGLSPRLNNKSYTISILKEGGKGHFLTFEEEPANFEFPLKSVATQEQVQQFVNGLFANDYFDRPRTGLEVFKLCQEKLGVPLRPALVADAIGFYTSKRKAPKLVKGKNESSREVFVKE